MRLMVHTRPSESYDVRIAGDQTVEGHVTLLNANARQPFSILILAADRGPHDPILSGTGAPCKALVPVGGRPMIARVLEVTLKCREAKRIVISTDRATDLSSDPIVGPILSDERIDFSKSAESPSASVIAALEELDDPYPMLVTTADSALISSEFIDYFWTRAVNSDADLTVGMAPASVILQQYPEAKRTFLKFRGGAYSGCNLFALSTPHALKALAFWQDIERHRKQPWRLIRAFGAGVLLRHLAGMLSLDAALAHASKQLGLSASAIIMPFAEAAFDVDKPADLDLANRIIADRQGG